MGERLFLPDLWLTGARIARARGDALAAGHAIQAAREEARRQNALWLELAAQAHWCEHAASPPDELAALRALRQRIGTSLDTPLLARVDGLLDEAT